MNIGIIGYGSMATALASQWVRTHDVMLSGRSLEKAQAAATPLSAKAGSPKEAAAFGDIIVLATPSEAVFDAIEEAGGPEAFAQKTVIDINNPIDRATITTSRTDGRSLTEAIAETLPESYVGKAFNMAQAKVWQDPDKTYDGRQMVTLYTADDEADTTIAKLIQDVGAEPLRLGSNTLAYQLEAAAAIVIRFLFGGGDAHTILNLIRPETKPIR